MRAPRFFFGMLTRQLRPSEIKLAKRWLDDLDRVQALLHAGDNLQKVKIVVLDTGFSPTHGDLQYDIEPSNYKDFVDGIDEERRDLTGHGTSIARMIIQVIDSVDLYVARVLRSEKSVDESFELVEKVSRSQETRNFWLITFVKLTGRQ